MDHSPEWADNAPSAWRFRDPVAVLTVLAVSTTRWMRARDYILLTAIFVRDRGDQGRYAGAKQILIALVMVMPVAMMVLCAAGIPIAPLLLLSIFALMLRHGCRQWGGAPFRAIAEGKTLPC